MPRSPRSDLLKLHVGRRLRAVREMIGLDQVTFGRHIGVFNASTLANWEAGSRLADVSAMVRLRGAFGIPLDWIFAGSLVGMDGLTQNALLELAEKLGAAVGAPVPELPSEVPHRDDGTPTRKPGGIPSRRPRATSLHEPTGAAPRLTGKPA